MTRMDLDVCENKHPRRKQRGMLSLPRTPESHVLDSRFRGNDDPNVWVLNPEENKDINARRHRNSKVIVQQSRCMQFDKH